jgi:hypothetical protein
MKHYFCSLCDLEICTLQTWRMHPLDPNHIRKQKEASVQLQQDPFQKRQKLTLDASIEPKIPVSPIVNSSFTNEKVYHPAVEMQITDEDEQNNNDMWIQDLVFGMQDNIQEDSQQPQIDPSEIEEMLQQSQIEDSENADNPFFYCR